MTDFFVAGGTPDGYVVPDTDYTNYAVAYSCKENGRGLLAGNESLKNHS